MFKNSIAMTYVCIPHLFLCLYSQMRCISDLHFSIKCTYLYIYTKLYIIIVLYNLWVLLQIHNHITDNQKKAQNLHTVANIIICINFNYICIKTSIRYAYFYPNTRFLMLLPCACVYLCCFSFIKQNVVKKTV